MIKRIKALIQENRISHKNTRLLLQEQNWAHVFHDSIRGVDYLENLPLNIGRYAGGYAFFYLLHRILRDHKPKSILEFGLGESSKFVSTYINNYLPQTTYLIIEHNQEWLDVFNSQFQLPVTTQVAICPLILKDVKGYESNHYQNLKTVISQPYNLYIIDGPNGSERYSRYDIIETILRLGKSDDFIILLDDCNRKGEQDTLKDILKYFKTENIKVHYGTYQGQKTVVVIASAKYQFINSM
ncbi:hypothetical protein ES711_14845 [Gelidibacter salicanalis]|uniref:Class I SAM-dependent methyltransferase n=1 Tax=Gelidibacter salicanalis TaxID=291193 RepID=A0A5C7ADB9_9FLAO|nr:hypothetical protein [Gelidibacter salicanalis]TXE05839.1 hypothetical protein ES711_14845 [Gelidibacter salicanalis]